MTREDILAFAIDRELEAARYYGEAAKVVSDQAVRLMLEGLVAEENGHARQLSELTDRLPEEPLPDDEKSASIIAAAEGDLAPPLPHDIEMVALLHHAIDREIEARQMYETFAHLVGAGQFADILNVLAEEERRHEAGFRRLVADLERARP